MNADGTALVNGNKCPRGAVYGERELTKPTRIVILKAEDDLTASDKFYKMPYGYLPDKTKLVVNHTDAGLDYIYLAEAEPEDGLIFKNACLYDEEYFDAAECG